MGVKCHSAPIRVVTLKTYLTYIFPNFQNLNLLYFFLILKHSSQKTFSNIPCYSFPFPGQKKLNNYNIIKYSNTKKTLKKNL